MRRLDLEPLPAPVPDMRMWGGVTMDGDSYVVTHDLTNGEWAASVRSGAGGYLLRETPVGGRDEAVRAIRAALGE